MTIRRDHSAKILPKGDRITHGKILPRGCVLKMSMTSRREYLSAMRQRYRQANSRKKKSQIIDEVMNVLDYHRKYAIQILNDEPSPKTPANRNKPLKYQEAMPAIQLVWEALDYPCAERLHPVLLSTAELLADHGELALPALVRQQLAQISRATLGRRLAMWVSPKPSRTLPNRKPVSRIQSQIPIDRYDWNENQPGALELDLVEHNGGLSLGHFAYTLTVVDVVTGYSRRLAILGRSQAAIFGALKIILSQWPFWPWGLHTDNGSEFLSDQLFRFCQENGLIFNRSRPYRKNDNAHAEQKNRQYVREIVGYERYDTPEEVAWLNEVYSYLDVYANLFLPLRKVVAKERKGAHVRKSFDAARTPFQRLIEADVLESLSFGSSVF